MCLRGVKVDPKSLAESRWADLRKMKVLQRILNALVGKHFNAGSSQQCVNYFHGTLKYPVVARSRETGAPSLDSKALYKLRTKHDNPLIDVIFAYRRVAKTFSMTEFEQLPLHKDNVC